MKRLTVKQLKAICKLNDYILLRYPSGERIGFNCKAAKIAARRKDYKDKAYTKFIYFIPCDFQTYITHKVPFIVKKRA